MIKAWDPFLETPNTHQDSKIVFFFGFMYTISFNVVKKVAIVRRDKYNIIMKCISFVGRISFEL